MINFSFAPNGGSSPTVFSGPFLLSVTRVSAGFYTLVMNGYNPKAVLAASVFGTDAGNADDTICTIDSFVISLAAKTVTYKIKTRTGTTGAVKDIAAAAGSFVRGLIHFKVYSGKDATGL